MILLFLHWFATRTVVNSVKDYGVHLLGTDVSAFPLTPYIVIAVPNSGDCSSPSNPTMSVATMLQPASRQSRASSSSSSSFQPVARQNTMSSHDTRSLRQSKRMSVTALYLSMSAKDRDLEISDDLARGMSNSGLSPMVALILRQHKSTCGIWSRGFRRNRKRTSC